MAQVIAAYEATSSEQLSLQKGQLIMIRKKSESGWWEGELQVRIQFVKLSENYFNLFIFCLVEGSPSPSGLVPCYVCENSSWWKNEWKVHAIVIIQN